MTIEELKHLKDAIDESKQGDYFIISRKGVDELHRLIDAEIVFQSFSDTDIKYAIDVLMDPGLRVITGGDNYSVDLDDVPKKALEIAISALKQVRQNEPELSEDQEINYVGKELSIFTGCGTNILIEKMYGPLVAYPIRVRLDFDSVCWIIERHKVFVNSDGEPVKNNWTEVARIEANEEWEEKID